MTKLIAAAVLVAGLAIAPAAQARISSNGVASGITVLPAAQARISANGVAVKTGTAASVQVVYIQLPRR